MHAVEISAGSRWDEYAHSSLLVTEKMPEFSMIEVRQGVFFVEGPASNWDAGLAEHEALGLNRDDITLLPGHGPLLRPGS